MKCGFHVVAAAVGVPGKALAGRYTNRGARSLPVRNLTLKTAKWRTRLATIVATELAKRRILTDNHAPAETWNAGFQ
jgi:hypothetical protein